MLLRGWHFDFRIQLKQTVQIIDLQSWTLNCRLSWYWDPLPLNNVAEVQRAAMVNVNSVATLFGKRGVEVYIFIVQDCLNFLNFRSLDYTLKNFLKPSLVYYQQQNKVPSKIWLTYSDLEGKTAVSKTYLTNSVFCFLQEMVRV